MAAANGPITKLTSDKAQRIENGVPNDNGPDIAACEAATPNISTGNDNGRTKPASSNPPTTPPANTPPAAGSPKTVPPSNRQAAANNPGPVSIPRAGTTSPDRPASRAPAPPPRTSAPNSGPSDGDQSVRPPADAGSNVPAPSVGIIGALNNITGQMNGSAAPSQPDSGGGLQPPAPPGPSAGTQPQPPIPPTPPTTPSPAPPGPQPQPPAPPAANDAANKPTPPPASPQDDGRPPPICRSAATESTGAADYAIYASTPQTRQHCGRRRQRRR